MYRSGLGTVRVVSDIDPCTDPTRQSPVQENLKSDPIRYKSCGFQVQSGTEVASEHKGPVPTEICIGYPGFDPTSNSEMGNRHISP